jgi:hypothetical protein
VPASGAKGITLHASDKFGGVHLEDPLFLDGWRFVENNVVTGQQIINRFGKILQSRSAGEITFSAEAGMVEDTGFFHEILFCDYVSKAAEPQKPQSWINPKSEYRNPKQIRISKIRMTETTDISFLTSYVSNI